MNEEQQQLCDDFTHQGIAAGFTEDQMIFMWNFIMKSMAMLIKMKR